MPSGPWVIPGQYTVRLTVSGQSYQQSLTVKIDPRVRTAPEGRGQQFTLSMQAYEGMRQTRQALNQIRTLRARIKELQERAGQGPVLEALTRLDRKATAIADAGEGSGRRGRRRTSESEEASLGRLADELGRLLETLQEADAAPTTQVVAACSQTQQKLTRLLARWAELKSKDMKTLNNQLREANLPTLAPDS
jgi:hypothetical protein